MKKLFMKKTILGITLHVIMLAAALLPYVVAAQTPGANLFYDPNATNGADGSYTYTDPSYNTSNTTGSGVNYNTGSSTGTGTSYNPYTSNGSGSLFYSSGVNNGAVDSFTYDDPASGDSLTSGSYTPVITDSATAPTYNSVACAKNFEDIPGIFDYVTCTIGNSIIPLLFGVAIMIFFYGVIKYVIAGDGSDDREEGRWFMIYGIIGLFVMVAVWGLVAVVGNTFNINTTVAPQFH